MGMWVSRGSIIGDVAFVVHSSALWVRRSKVCMGWDGISTGDLGV